MKLLPGELQHLGSKFTVWQILAGKSVDADGPGRTGGLHVQGLHGGPLPTPGHCWSRHRFVCPEKKTKLAFTDMAWSSAASAFVI